MEVFGLSDLITTARTKCPFYRDFYRKVPQSASLADLPIVDQAAFWAAHAEDRSNVLTAPLKGGIVANSGGTSGSPKFSYYTRAEYNSSMEMSGMAFVAAGLKEGQRVANLFPGGDMYSAFLTAAHSLHKAEVETLHFPIGFLSSDEFIADIATGFEIDCVAGMPSRLYKLFEYLQKNRPAFKIDRVLYAGEPFYPSQEQQILSLFPGAKIRSGGYGSVDAGILGYADDECSRGEHKVFGDCGLLEIVDESGAPISEPDQPGAIVATNLTRKLMPMLRYPTGDRAAWCDDATGGDRKLRLLGRGKEAARLADVNVYPVDILRIAQKAAGIDFGPIQLITTSEMGIDSLKVLLATDSVSEISGWEDMAFHIKQSIFAEQPVLQKMIQARIIGEVSIRVVSASELMANARSGKVSAVVDLRQALAA